MREITTQQLIRLQDMADEQVAWEVLAMTLCDDAGKPLYDDAADCKSHFDYPISTLNALTQKVLDASAVQKKT
jgi:hypothetical protein